MTKCIKFSYSEYEVKAFSPSLKWLCRVGLTPRNDSLVPSKTVKSYFKQEIYMFEEKKSGRYRKMLSVTIDPKILECFDYCAKKHALNKSQFIENAIKIWLEQIEPNELKKQTSQLTDLDKLMEGK